MSRQHLCLERHGDELWVEDLGSRAGTRLNGRPLVAGARFTDRDLLELSAESRIVVRSAAGAATAGRSYAALPVPPGVLR